MDANLPDIDDILAMFGDPAPNEMYPPQLNPDTGATPAPLVNHIPGTQCSLALFHDTRTSTANNPVYLPRFVVADSAVIEANRALLSADPRLFADFVASEAESTISRAWGSTAETNPVDATLVFRQCVRALPSAAAAIDSAIFSAFSCPTPTQGLHDLSNAVSSALSELSAIETNYATAAAPATGTIVSLRRDLAAAMGVLATELTVVPRDMAAPAPLLTHAHAIATEPLTPRALRVVDVVSRAATLPDPIIAHAIAPRRAAVLTTTTLYRIAETGGHADADDGDAHPEPTLSEISHPFSGATDLRAVAHNTWLVVAHNTYKWFTHTFRRRDCLPGTLVSVFTSRTSSVVYTLTESPQTRTLWASYAPSPHAAPHPSYIRLASVSPSAIITNDGDAIAIADTPAQAPIVVVSRFAPTAPFSSSFTPVRAHATPQNGPRLAACTLTIDATNVVLRAPPNNPAAQGDPIVTLRLPPTLANEETPANAPTPPYNGEDYAPTPPHNEEDYVPSPPHNDEDYVPSPPYNGEDRAPSPVPRRPIEPPKRTRRRRRPTRA